MNPSPQIHSLIERIHDAPQLFVVAITGGGSRAIADLLEVPGASRTVLEARVPYAAQAMRDLLGAVPDHYCSEQTARAMAMACFECARALSDLKPDKLCGVACTASLASDRRKRGPHRIHVALQTSSETHSWSVELTKGMRKRDEEENVACVMTLAAMAAGCKLKPCEIPLLAEEQIDHQNAKASDSWDALLLGEATHVPQSEMAEQATSVIFPGSFNPLHEGHRQMIAIAGDRLGAPVALEISLLNVDKPPLDFIELRERVARLTEYPVWLTRAPTFVEKSILFPGATFVVGADTILRMADAKYYDNDPTEAAAAIDTIARADCRFLVFGRTVGPRFLSTAEIDLPPQLAAMCTYVPEAQFRCDISSTAIRELGA